MRNLRFYETDAAFKAYEQSAGGNGVSTMTSIPGVSNTRDLGKTYFNPHDKPKLTHTFTINYKNINGETIAESETVSIGYYDGVKQKIILEPKNIDGYSAIRPSKTVTVPTNDSVTFKYYSSEQLNTPLTFNIISSGTIYWKAAAVYYTVSIEYKKNDGEWTSITSKTGSSAPSISVSAGDVLQFRGDNAAYSHGSYYNYFESPTAKFEVEGNIMSLIDSENFATTTTLVSSYTFYSFFKECTGLTSAEKLVLPATTLVYSCYNSMFSGCTSLTSAPELPATTLARECYSFMFAGCSSLTTAPELPATTLARECYSFMFQGCTGLTTAPELPATTLEQSCYRSMFQRCTSLTTAQELPATTLVYSCYNSMFAGCTSLTSAPELQATTLSDSCYNSMFYGCTSLNYIKCLATDISASNCTLNWVVGVSSSGTFVKNPDMSSWTTGTSNIPVNWTVQDAS